MGDEYDSAFEGDSFRPPASRKQGLTSSCWLKDPILKPKMGGSSQKSEIPPRAVLNDLSCQSIGQVLRYHQSSLTAYDRHKMLVNQYFLYHPGATSLLQRDSSRDVRDMDVVRAHHQFLWDSNDDTNSWQKALAKKYYDKLFKEYCICDLSRYKENKVGLRWRTDAEVQEGKGQFKCGEKRCPSSSDLTSWEMNFAYKEHGLKKNALVKLRLCSSCSPKLNHCKQRPKASSKRKRLKKSSSSLGRRSSDDHHPDNDGAQNSGSTKDTSTSSSGDGQSPTESEGTSQTEEADCWKKPIIVQDEKSRDDEFEEYLEDLLL
ncbi:Folate-sensitive fragile site protein Fra10Ac1 [Trinorchestia longiramus]|nr:Folate-sensitive fragile site protein Fra10Ac1 [Trinorchestia longiramus]